SLFVYQWVPLQYTRDQSWSWPPADDRSLGLTHGKRLAIATDKGVSAPESVYEEQAEFFRRWLLGPTMAGLALVVFTMFSFRLFSKYVPKLIFTMIALLLLAGCSGVKEKLIDADSGATSTPAISPMATPTSPISTTNLTRDEVNRRYAEFDSKPKFLGELNQIVFYEDRPEFQPDAATLGIPKCADEGARQASKAEAKASRLDFILGYLQPAASIGDDMATACQYEVVTITRSFSSPGYGWVGIVRMAGRPMVPANAPREYLREATLGGRPAVIRSPIIPKQRMAIWMRDDTSKWTVSCNGMDETECVKIAAGLQVASNIPAAISSPSSTAMPQTTATTIPQATATAIPAGVPRSGSSSLQLAIVDSDGDISLISHDGTGKKKLIDGEQCPKPINLIWSPTGDKLACLNYEPLESQFSRYEVVIVDVEGQMLGKIGPLDTFAWSFAWSPSGQHLAYGVVPPVTPRPLETYYVADYTGKTIAQLKGGARLLTNDLLQGIQG
ncbi:MAG: hypothetical protein Q7O66_20065, partial [Dehalococcoidia bacterium]|nr:hypothetical protein [Dehalococcoidia bacterium]